MVDDALLLSLQELDSLQRGREPLSCTQKPHRSWIPLTAAHCVCLGWGRGSCAGWAPSGGGRHAASPVGAGLRAPCARRSPPLGKTAGSGLEARGGRARGAGGGETKLDVAFGVGLACAGRVSQGGERQRRGLGRAAAACRVHPPSATPPRPLLPVFPSTLDPVPFCLAVPPPLTGYSKRGVPPQGATGGHSAAPRPTSVRQHGRSFESVGVSSNLNKQN